jgi:hypothetical protein
MLAVAILCGLLSSLCILGYQVYVWLRFGNWVWVPVSRVIQDQHYDYSWVGLGQLIEWCLDLPIILVTLFILPLAIMILAPLPRLIRRRRRGPHPTPASSRLRFKLRTETLVAAATCFAAIAAGLSVWTALRQETATYDSQLYGKQVDIIGPIFAELGHLNINCEALDENGNRPEYRANCAASMEKFRGAIVEREGVMFVAFPEEVANILKGMSDDLEESLPALRENKNLMDVVKSQRITMGLNLLVECIRPLLAEGRPIKSDCSAAILEAPLN